MTTMVRGSSDEEKYLWLKITRISRNDLNAVDGDLVFENQYVKQKGDYGYGSKYYELTKKSIWGAIVAKGNDERRKAEKGGDKTMLPGSVIVTGVNWNEDNEEQPYITLQFGRAFADKITKELDVANTRDMAFTLNPKEIVRKGGFVRICEYEDEVPNSNSIIPQTNPRLKNHYNDRTKQGHVLSALVRIPENPEEERQAELLQELQEELLEIGEIQRKDRKDEVIEDEVISCKTQWDHIIEVKAKFDETDDGDKYQRESLCSSLIDRFMSCCFGV